MLRLLKLFFVVTGKLPVSDVIKNAERKELSVFLGNYNKADGCTLNNVTTVGALDIGSNYFCSNLEGRSYGRFYG